METLVNWYAENGSALWATIVSFFSAYGVALVSLIIAIIKLKLNAIAQNKASSAQVQAITQTYIEKLNEVEAEIIKASNVNTEKRIAAMQDIANTVAEANDSLKPAEQINDANDALESLE